MKGLLLKSLTVFLSLNIVFPAPLLAADPKLGLSLSEEVGPAARGNEYVSGNYPGAILMKVNLWGAVQRPGIHYIPARTDLVTLFSYAGGPAGEAKTNSITIKRQSNGKDIHLDVDLDDLIYGTKQAPILEPNDIIVVPASRPLVGPNTVTAITVISSVLGIVLSGFAISYAVKGK